MCVRNPRLPLLPGYSPNPLIGKSNFGLRPLFTSINKVNMLVDKREDINRIPSLYARKGAPDLPAWVVYDKQILRFHAYFQQTLHEVRNERSVIRIVDIFYHLEDGTIKVMEPKVENSGLLQGMLISRQRIKIPGKDNTFYDVLDLNVGKEVEFYGKVFKIVDCDNFTRVFLNRLGIHVPDRISLNIEEPQYGHMATPTHTKHKASLRQFLDFDRKVLRFNAYWDDSETQFGIIHHLEIMYYLSDDTMEIREVIPKNAGREAGSILVKRSKIPKKMPPYVPMSNGHTYEVYSPIDLSLGGVLNVYNRKVVLTDCDAFTKEYYRARYGIDNFTPVPPPKDKEDCIPAVGVQRELPPWNGYGSYEDSAENCRTVEPKAPHRDFVKFLHKDRVGYDSHILRFGARLMSKIPNNKIRYFVISYYLSDDTISVFELGERNSGFMGGRFFRRVTMPLPGQEKFASQPPNAYTAQDMWLGNELVLNEHCFKLFTADEYALRYMEIHSDEFPKSNINVIMEYIRSVLATPDKSGIPLYKNFVARHMSSVLPDKKNIMPIHCFKQALKEVMCEKLTEHEFITVARFFRGDAGKEKRPTRDMLRSLIFSTLTRFLWDARERLRENFLHTDEHGMGRLPRHRVRQLLRGNRFPVPDDLMDCMLDVLDKTPDCQIRYDDLFTFLDFETRPVPHMSEAEYRALIRHALPVKDTECKQWRDLDSFIEPGYVDWEAFLCQLNLEHIIKE